MPATSSAAPSLSWALLQDFDVIKKQEFSRAEKEFYQELRARRHSMQAIVKHHLGLHCQDACITSPDRWIGGSFNVCIPVEVRSARLPKKYMLRCAKPYKLAAGKVDEKVSSEVGTYVWMQDRCSDIRIPRLYGFGFSNHRHFTHEEQRPFYILFMRLFLRFSLALFLFLGLFPSSTLLSHYTLHPTQERLPTAYILLEDIRSDNCQMLSQTWEKHYKDPIRRKRLICGISRFFLSLARFPQSRIGSFQFHPNCTVSLTNRPLPCCVPIMESYGASQILDRTYSTVERFMFEMFAFHDKYFLSNRSAAEGTHECHFHMTVMALLRTISHHFIQQEFRDGPFFLQPTDFHQSNIFVDADWNVTGFVDLEWVCALPIEAINIPYWFTGYEIDELDSKEKCDEFRIAQQEFMDTMVSLEFSDHGLLQVISDNWESCGECFWRCLFSHNARIFLFRNHLDPLFRPSPGLCKADRKVFFSYWHKKSAKLVETKVLQFLEYKKELEQICKLNTAGT